MKLTALDENSSNKLRYSFASSRFTARLRTSRRRNDEAVIDPHKSRMNLNFQYSVESQGNEFRIV